MTRLYFIYQILQFKNKKKTTHVVILFFKKAVDTFHKTL